MAIEESLYAHLTGAATVVALVGTAVYPAGETPQNVATDHVTYQKITNTHAHHQGGASGLTETRIQVNCWSRSAKGARDLAEAIRLCTDGFRGEWSELAIASVFVDDDSATFTTPTDDSETGRFLETLDLLVWHAETIPTLS